VACAAGAGSRFIVVARLRHLDDVVRTSAPLIQVDMSATVSISNGTEFYTIPQADLAEARGDGFYVPFERGLTIVSNGDEIFEIPLADLPEAERDGFRDLLAGERAPAAAAASLSTDRPAPASPLRLPPPPPSLATGGGPPAATQRAGAAAGGPPSAAGRSSNRASAKPEAVAPPLAIDTHEEEEQRRQQERAELLTTLSGIARWRAQAEFWWEDHRGPILKHCREYGVSTGLHAAALLILGLWAITSAPKPPNLAISTAMSDTDTPADDPAPEAVDMNLDTSLEEVAQPTDAVSQDVVSLDVSNLPPATDLLSSLLNAPGLDVQIAGELAGRTEAGKQAALLKHGGTLASERAVNESLKWLARHQLPDGGWSYDTVDVKSCDCTEPGTFKEGRLSATGLALTTFLGAGHTSIDGEHAAIVRAGTAFLLRSGKPGEGGTFDLRSAPAGNRNEGIYEQAICTTALCESLGMVRMQLAISSGRIQLADGRTADRRVFVQMEQELAPKAQGAINWLVRHQEADGGWKYHPNHSNAPDTSVHGWCLMALLSGKHAGLTVPQKTLDQAQAFLNTVAADGGAFYGYNKPDKRLSTTGIGLLCRMYGGWRREEPALKKGVSYLSTSGPRLTDMYYTYYATQVMHHWGGDEWVKWNLAARDGLIASQEKTGHAAGSWPAKGVGHGEKGGRLFVTCLATMTLEVYYRHLPIYRDLDQSASPDRKVGRSSAAPPAPPLDLSPPLALSAPRGGG